VSQIDVELLHRGQNQSTKSLSGGEKSFSTVSLLLALWGCMECAQSGAVWGGDAVTCSLGPFRALDEFDVFMDAVNRKISIGLLVEVSALVTCCACDNAVTGGAQREAESVHFRHAARRVSDSSRARCGVTRDRVQPHNAYARRCEDNQDAATRHVAFSLVCVAPRSHCALHCRSTTGHARRCAHGMNSRFCRSITHSMQRAQTSLRSAHQQRKRAREQHYICTTSSTLPPRLR
jgi:hypothetical protein